MKVSNECELGNFYISKKSWCESCGSIPFDITWSDGLTFWCLDCARYNEEFEEPTAEILKELDELKKKLVKEL